jgi:hypothetical protein
MPASSYSKNTVPSRSRDGAASAASVQAPMVGGASAHFTVAKVWWQDPSARDGKLREEVITDRVHTTGFLQTDSVIIADAAGTGIKKDSDGNILLQAPEKGSAVSSFDAVNVLAIVSAAQRMWQHALCRTQSI